MSVRTFVSVEDLANELYGACNLHSDYQFESLPSNPQKKLVVLLNGSYAIPPLDAPGVVPLAPRSGERYVILVSLAEKQDNRIYTVDTRRSITIPLEVPLKDLGPAINISIATNYPDIQFLNKTWDLKTRTFYVAAPRIDFRKGIQDGERVVYGPGEARALRYYCGTSSGVYKKVNDTLQELFRKWGSSAER